MSLSQVELYPCRQQFFMNSIDHSAVNMMEHGPSQSLVGVPQRGLTGGWPRAGQCSQGCPPKKQCSYARTRTDNTCDVLTAVSSVNGISQPTAFFEGQRSMDSIVDHQATSYESYMGLSIPGASASTTIADQPKSSADMPLKLLSLILGRELLPKETEEPDVNEVSFPLPAGMSLPQANDGGFIQANAIPLRYLTLEIVSLIPKDENEEYLSVGSTLHDKEQCRGCVFFNHASKTCRNGIRCLFCHYKHDKKKKRSRHKKNAGAAAMAERTVISGKDGIGDLPISKVKVLPGVHQSQCGREELSFAPHPWSRHGSGLQQQPSFGRPDARCLGNPSSSLSAHSTALAAKAFGYLAERDQLSELSFCGNENPARMAMEPYFPSPNSVCFQPRLIQSQQPFFSHSLHSEFSNLNHQQEQEQEPPPDMYESDNGILSVSSAGSSPDRYTADDVFYPSPRNAQSSFPLSLPEPSTPISQPSSVLDDGSQQLSAFIQCTSPTTPSTSTSMPMPFFPRQPDKTPALQLNAGKDLVQPPNQFYHMDAFRAAFVPNLHSPKTLPPNNPEVEGTSPAAATLFSHLLNADETVSKTMPALHLSPSPTSGQKKRAASRFSVETSEVVSVIGDGFVSTRTAADSDELVVVDDNSTRRNSQGINCKTNRMCSSGDQLEALSHMPEGYKSKTRNLATCSMQGSRSGTWKNRNSSSSIEVANVVASVKSPQPKVVLSDATAPRDGAFTVTSHDGSESLCQGSHGSKRPSLKHPMPSFVSSPNAEEDVTSVRFNFSLPLAKHCAANVYAPLDTPTDGSNLNFLRYTPRTCCNPGSARSTFFSEHAVPPLSTRRQCRDAIMERYRGNPGHNRRMKTAPGYTLQRSFLSGCSDIHISRIANTEPNAPTSFLDVLDVTEDYGTRDAIDSADRLILECLEQLIHTLRKQVYWAQREERNDSEVQRIKKMMRAEIVYLAEQLLVPDPGTCVTEQASPHFDNT